MFSLSLSLSLVKFYFIVIFTQSSALHGVFGDGFCSVECKVGCFFIHWSHFGILL
jgi:hypothetical protein